MKRLYFRDGSPIDTIGLGTWKSDDDSVKDAVIFALENGYRHLDCAAIYGNESAIGEALKEVFAKGKIKRKDVFITSKLWNNAHLQEDVAPALKKTLADLQLDYLDLYLIHWPVAFKPNVMFAESAEGYLPLSEAPIAATWKAMEELQYEGLAKHIGVSNFSVKKLENLIQFANIVPEMNQVELHPLLAQDDLLAFCKEHKILLTAYSPLGSRDRSDAMKANDEPNMFELPEVNEIAQRHKVTPAQVLLNYHQFRDCCVIPKSTNPGRIIENYLSYTLGLHHEDMEQLAKLDRGYRYVTGKFFDCPEKGYENVYDE